MVENCKKALDQENKYGALVTDLSKAFDCLQPYGCETSRIWFFDRIVKTNKNPANISTSVQRCF